MDYREQLGIGFDDSEKGELFIARVHNRFMQGKSLCISLENERAFCYQVGALCERDRDSLSLYPEYQGGSTSASGLDRVWSDYFEDYDQPYPHYLFDDEGEEEVEEEKKQSRLEFYEFLALVVTLRNCCKDERDVCEYLTNTIEEALRDSYIPFEWVDEGDGDLFAFPQGAPELDNALVSEPLTWLSAWPYSRAAFVDALKYYAEADRFKPAEIAWKFDRALETFFQEFFDRDKLAATKAGSTGKRPRSLENYKSDYGSYLRDRGIPPEIAGNLETLMQAYTTLENNHAKHQDTMPSAALEYLMYQTGNIVRLLVRLHSANKLAQASSEG